MKIRNYEASTIFEVNNGVRERMEFKDAMLTNSLFLDYLYEIGLDTYKDESTKDIVCINFNWGSRSYEEEQIHLQTVIRRTKIEKDRAILKNDKIAINICNQKINKILQMFESARANKNNYIKYSSDELRTIFYNDGINITYITKKRDGTNKKVETIHYKMLFRSTGKAKKGSCMFIRDRLYKKAINFIRMGIDLNKKPLIVEMSAYSSLISSGIVGKVQINPRNILVLKDIDKFFNTKIVAIKTDANKHCYTEHIDNYKLKNTLFDGQALIDSSIFPKWGEGYILLRQHFCKMAAFNCNIQDFYKDYFGDRYEAAIVKDMWGNEHFAKDIQLITTDNALKFLKWQDIGIDYDYWCKWVNKNDNYFGIVKTAHSSKHGNNQKMSYQMINSLNIETMNNVLETNLDYVKHLKNDDDFFFDYLQKNTNFSNDYDVLIALCKHNKDFIRSSYFRSRKNKIIQNYILNMKSGEVLNEGENLTIVGSPYAMLLYSASGNEKDVDNDISFVQEEGTIQCYTERFEDGEFLAGFRSPFNSKNNLTYMHNVYSDVMQKYFNLGKNCIAINMIGTDAQDRNNGSDQDSDFMYTTNQPQIVSHAKYCYDNYPTIVNIIPKENNLYKNTLDDFALIDNKLSASQTDIGESSNLAQLAQTYSYSFPNEKKYDDYVCILSVLAQIAIDSSKRMFDIDIVAEIKSIRKDMDISKNGYPKFWSIIKKDFNRTNINPRLICPMNILFDIKNEKIISNTPTLPMEHFFIKHPMDIKDKKKKRSKKVEKIIEKYSFKLTKTIINSEKEYNDWILLRVDFNRLVRDIEMMYISNNYVGLMSWLIDRAFIISPYVKAKSNFIQSNLCKNRRIFLKILYSVSPTSFLSCFVKNQNINF